MWTLAARTEVVDAPHPITRITHDRTQSSPSSSLSLPALQLDLRSRLGDVTATARLPVGSSLPVLTCIAATIV